MGAKDIAWGKSRQEIITQEERDQTVQWGLNAAQGVNAAIEAKGFLLTGTYQRPIVGFFEHLLKTKGGNLPFHVEASAVASTTLPFVADAVIQRETRSQMWQECALAFDHDEEFRRYTHHFQEFIHNFAGASTEDSPQYKGRACSLTRMDIHRYDLVSAGGDWRRSVLLMLLCDPSPRDLESYMSKLATSLDFNKHAATAMRTRLIEMISGTRESPA